jgi:hypothetical protein
MTDDRMDRELQLWAGADLADDAAVARLLAHADGLAGTPQHGRPLMPWALAGGALAASIAAAALLLAPPGQPEPDRTASGAPIAARADDADIESFAMLHTTTTEEEMFL